MPYRIMQHRGSGAVKVEEELHPGYWANVRGEVREGLWGDLLFNSLPQARAWVEAQQLSTKLHHEELWEVVEVCE